MPFNQALRKKSHVLWMVSLIQDISPEAQTKAEFANMMNDVVGNDPIEKVTFCLADNLQRFRFMIEDGSTEAEAMTKCQELATKWHVDNDASLEKLKSTKAFSILTWNEFLNWPEYGKTIKEIEQLYKENKEFRNDVDGRVRQEFKNISPNAKLTDNTQQILLLKQYLFEECAFQKFGASKRFDYELYKTPMNKAMRRIKNNSEFVAPGLMTEVHFTQFNPSPKKNGPAISKGPESSIVFKPLFSNPTPTRTIETKSQIKKVGEFAENAIALLSPEQQDKASKALIEFITKEIMPLYYQSNTPINTN